MTPVPEHRYRGAAALVRLHEREMRAFLAEWERARERGVTLPPSEHAEMASLEGLLDHVLEAAGGYLKRVTTAFDLPEPDLPGGRSVADAEPLLDAWRNALVAVEEERFFDPLPTSWGDLNAELILEHAVVHPMRHRLQIADL